MARHNASRHNVCETVSYISGPPLKVLPADEALSNLLVEIYPVNVS